MGELNEGVRVDIKRWNGVLVIVYIEYWILIRKRECLFWEIVVKICRVFLVGMLLYYE